MRASAPWPPGFIEAVHEAVREEKVRFLGGVFECPSTQAVELGRMMMSWGMLEHVTNDHNFKNDWLFYRLADEDDEEDDDDEEEEEE